MPKMKKPKALDRYPEPEDIKRFLSFVEFNEFSECWLWTGHKDKKGYGQFSLFGQAQWASRVSHLIFKGPIPPGKEAHHDGTICHNPSCVNPNHITDLTKSENVAEGNRRNGWRGAVARRMRKLGRPHRAERGLFK